MNHMMLSGVVADEEDALHMSSAQRQPSEHLFMQQATFPRAKEAGSQGRELTFRRAISTGALEKTGNKELLVSPYLSSKKQSPEKTTPLLKGRRRN